MTRIRRATEEEWRSLGERIYQIRNEIQDLALEAQEFLPAKTLDRLLRVVHQIDQFRSDAEEEMWRRGGPRDLDVFYPTGIEGSRHG